MDQIKGQIDGQIEHQSEHDIAHDAGAAAIDTAGSVTGGVRVLLRLEGLTLFVGMILLYAAWDGSWLVFERCWDVAGPRPRIGGSAAAPLQSARAPATPRKWTVHPTSRFRAPDAFAWPMAPARERPLRLPVFA